MRYLVLSILTALVAAAAVPVFAHRSPVIKVAFEPEENPLQKTLIKYEWSEALCKKGLLLCRKEPRNRLWDEDNYAPYPPEYHGR